MSTNTSFLRVATILAIGATLVLAVLLWRKNQQPERNGKESPAVGKEYLAAEFPALIAPGPIQGKGLGGKVVLINFWGWWCEPCQIEFPHLMELEQSLRDNSDFCFISVASSGDPNSDESDSELRDRTQAYLTERRADVATYKDPFAAEQKRLATLAGKSFLGYPATIILDRHGIICGLWVGYRPGDELSMRAVIDEALNRR